MAEEIDPKVSIRYRELGAEEPPRALDEAILAAARRPLAGERGPVRSPARRLAGPLSLAAVVVLSVVVTLRMQHERPEVASPAPAPATAPLPAAKETAPAALPDEKPQSRPKAEQQPKPPARLEPAPIQSPIRHSPIREKTQAPASRDDTARDAGAAAQALSRPAAETPEKELERIAQLRREGRQEDADKALAEFRQRYPDYRIPDATLERVEKR